MCFDVWSQRLEHPTRSTSHSKLSTEKLFSDRFSSSKKCPPPPFPRSFLRTQTWRTGTAPAWCKLHTMAYSMYSTRKYRHYLSIYIYMYGMAWRGMAWHGMYVIIWNSMIYVYVIKSCMYPQLKWVYPTIIESIGHSRSGKDEWLYGIQSYLKTPFLSKLNPTDASPKNPDFHMSERYPSSASW